MDDLQCRNHTCLVLTGEQGKFKTTFLDLLCPKELKSYLFTGKIDPQGKDVQTLIAEYLFIYIDAAKEININKVYSKAVELWRVDYHYWFYEEEIAELHQESEGFQVQTGEYEMFLKGMGKPAATEEGYMTTSEILNYLRGYTTFNLREAFKKAGFLRKSKG